MEQPPQAFELLEHTADVGIRAYGRTLKEAFENAARATFSIITDLNLVEEKQDLRVRVEADDTGALLVAWLNELIYLFETEKIIFKSFDISDWDQEHYLEARVRGEPVDVGRHPIETQIKACTYHMLRVEKDSFFTVQVIFDV